MSTLFCAEKLWKSDLMRDVILVLTGGGGRSAGSEELNLAQKCL